MKFRLYMIAVVVLLTSFALEAQDAGQRHVTPVKPSTNKVLRPAKGTKEEVVQDYLSGDTAAARARLRRDSLKRVYPRYPKLTDVTVGVNILDPVLKLFGQKYCSFDVSATLNMWNRLQPVLELGLGYAKDRPDDMNFTYKGKLSPYVRLGANYNMMFKSDPRYQVVLGLRMGYSMFNYDITAIDYSNPYWGENYTFAIKDQSSHALWGEFLAGLRVNVWRNISAGWQVKYQGIFNYKKNSSSRPWYVPGFGPRDRRWGFSFSLYYTIPLQGDKWPKKQNKQPQQQPATPGGTAIGEAK
jgi:hypothetical protein